VRRPDLSLIHAYRQTALAAKPQHCAGVSLCLCSRFPLEPRNFDVVVSNCVVNLSVYKPAVPKGSFDLLKPGGRVLISPMSIATGSFLRRCVPILCSTACLFAAQVSQNGKLKSMAGR
jgi:hypothetical protein